MVCKLDSRRWRWGGPREGFFGVCGWWRPYFPMFRGLWFGALLEGFFGTACLFSGYLPAVSYEAQGSLLLFCFYV